MTPHTAPNKLTISHIIYICDQYHIISLHNVLEMKCCWGLLCPLC